jgi:hypothetical protein
MKSLIVLLMLSAPALAQGYVGPVPFQWCYEGIYFAARPDGTCNVEDKGKMPTFSLTTDKPGIGTSSSNVITNRVLKCPDGYSLVSVGRPMCARDLIEPE